MVVVEGGGGGADVKFERSQEGGYQHRTSANKGGGGSKF